MSKLFARTIEGSKDEEETISARAVGFILYLLLCYMLFH